MSSTPISQILPMTDLVEYQSGTVVSRQITSAPSGNVTLFAFDKDQELSEHTSPFDAMVYLLDGNAEVMISKKVTKIKAGEAIIMPANEPHALIATTRFKMLLIMIKA